MLNRESRFQVRILNFQLFITYSISGYGGYIRGIKSENVFGETYGKTTYQSSAGEINRGVENPPHVKYSTTMKSEFVDTAVKAQKSETVAAIVGVNKGEDMYKKPVLASEKYAFYGAEAPAEVLAEEAAHHAAQAAHREALAYAAQDGPKEQSVEEATHAFFCQPPPNPNTAVEKLGEPIPGYSGVNRRISADNVFGMTYAEARKMA